MSNTKAYDKRHGGPYDRGSADSYYGRGVSPHYYTGRTSLRGDNTFRDVLTSDELEAYMAGYNDNEAEGNKKEY